MKANIIPIWHGWVKDGRITLNRTKDFARYVADFEGKGVDMLVRETKDIRSKQQNAYWHGIVVEMVREAMGELDHEITHEYLKYKFNYRIVTIKGEEVRLVLSTANLSKKRFGELWGDVQIWAAQDLGITIPDPNEAMPDYEWDES